MAQPALITASGTYNYEPLPNERSIRLLRIKPGLFSDQITCSIVTASLDWGTRFEALSYTWGDPQPAHAIQILEEQGAIPSQPQHGKHKSAFWLSVGENLFQALRHIRTTEYEVVLWADAICIDQANVAEKSQQIQLMSEIYSKADQVIVWLGLSDADSQIAFAWAHKTEEQASALWEQQYMSAEANHSSIQKATYTPVADIDHGEIDALVATFTSHKKRAWWYHTTLSHRTIDIPDLVHILTRDRHRRWIVQEFAFARYLIFQCGNDTLQWDVLEIATMLLRSDLESQKSRIGTDALQVYQRGMFAISCIEDLRAVRDRMLLDSTAPNLQQQLAECTAFANANPRDNVYAILSLSNLAPGKIVPDYARMVHEVYLDAAMVMIEEGKNLDVLCGDRVRSCEQEHPAWYQDEMHLIPSWLPEYAHGGGMKPTRPSFGPRLPRPVLHQYDSSKGHASCVHVEKAGGQSLLHMKGMHLETIHLQKPLGAQGGQAADNWISPLVDIPDLPFEATYDHLRVFEEYRALFTRGSQSVQTDLVRALLQNRDPTERGEPPLSEATLGQCCQAFEHFLARKTDQHDARRLLRTPAELQEYLVSANIALRLKLSYKDGWRFGLLNSGRFAWLPYLAQTGDVLYIPFGSKIPFVLRSVPVSGVSAQFGKDEPHFVMVGTAYVHGVMQGEVFHPDAYVHENATAVVLH